jgi:hypothetical protein
VLFYYLGGSIGITVSGTVFGHGGWRWVGGIGVLMLCTTFAAGIAEMREGTGNVRTEGEGKG